MKAIDAYDILFPSMLGRSVTSAEREEIERRFGAQEVDTRDIAAEIIRSTEFFGLHREAFIDHQFPTSTVVTARGPLGHQIHCDLRQLHLGLSMACGHYEPDETAFIRKHVTRGMTVLDVGANIGFFTTMMAGLVGASGKVIALEPVNDTYQKLSSAISMNGQQSIVELHNVAASSGQGSFELSYDLNSFNMGGVSLSREGETRRAKITQKAVTSKIDELVWGRPIHFMKMDIEGAEGMALDGAEQTLRSSKPLIIMEFNEPQLVNVSGISALDLFKKVLSFGYASHSIRQAGGTVPLSEDQLVDTISAGNIVNVAFTPN